MTGSLDREVLVACKTLRTEIRHVEQESGISRRTIWLEAHLHDVPAKLTLALQDVLDSIVDADRVILGYANCGNAVQGLVSGDFELIVPRLDDCISLVFGSQDRRQEYGRAHASLFFTDGWLNEGRSIVDEYEHAVQRYGDQTAGEIMNMVYEHYRTMTFLDTGLYDVGGLMDRTRGIADMCGLCQRVQPGTLDYVRELVCGPWDPARFVHVPPGRAVPSEPFAVPGSVPVPA